MSGAPSRSIHFSYIFVTIRIIINIGFDFSNSFDLKLYFHLVFAIFVCQLSILASLVINESRFSKISCLSFIPPSKAHSFHKDLFLFLLLLRFLLGFLSQGNLHMPEFIESNEVRKCSKAKFQDL